MAQINKKYGDSCTLSGTPNTGYKFDNWSAGGSVLSTSNPYTFVVTSDLDVTGNFSLLEFTLTGTSNPLAGGEVLFDYVPEEGSRILYESPTAATSSWISANTDTSKNTFSNGTGTLYLNRGVNTLGDGTSAVFGTTPVTKVDTTNFTYSNNSRNVTTVNTTTIAAEAFNENTSITQLIIGPDVRWIGQRAFDSCTSLQSVTFKGSTAIGDSVFNGCTSLSTVTFANNGNLSSIGESAFNSCTSLTTITLPTGIKYIAPRAFYGCSHLSSISLPEGLEMIGEMAFNGIAANTNIVLPESIGSITQDIISTNCSLTIKSYAPPILPLGDSSAKRTAIVANTALSNYQNNAFWPYNFNISGTSSITPLTTTVPDYGPDYFTFEDLEDTLGAYHDADCYVYSSIWDTIGANKVCTKLLQYCGDPELCSPYQSLIDSDINIYSDKLLTTLVGTGTLNSITDTDGQSTINWLSHSQNITGGNVYYVKFNYTLEENGDPESQIIGDGVSAVYAMTQDEYEAWTTKFPQECTDPEPEPEPEEEYCECCGEPLENGECINTACECSPYYDGGGEEPEPDPEEEPEE